MKAFEQIGLPAAITSRARQHEDDVNSEGSPPISAEAIVYSVVDQADNRMWPCSFWILWNPPVMWFIKGIRTLVH